MESPGFNSQQWQELFTLFSGICVDMEESILPVRDGIIRKGDKVWWRGLEGPEQVDSVKHWFDIRHFQNNYQIENPKTQIQYLD